MDNSNKLIPFTELLSQIEVDGLVKLIPSPPGYYGGRCFCVEKEQRIPGLDTTEDCLETVWFYSAPLVRADGKPFQILQAYSPILRQLPPTSNHSHDQERRRIAVETKELADYVRQDTRRTINAVHLSILSHEYGFSGELENSREYRGTRTTFMTSFYEIENN